MVKNYGIWIRYQSRTGFHNMYKEYRDCTLNGAVEQLYDEMAGRHRVRKPCLQIIKARGPALPQFSGLWAAAAARARRRRPADRLPPCRTRCASATTRSSSTPPTSSSPSPARSCGRRPRASRPPSSTCGRRSPCRRSSAAERCCGCSQSPKSGFSRGGAGGGPAPRRRRRTDFMDYAVHSCAFFWCTVFISSLAWPPDTPPPTTAAPFPQQLALCGRPRAPSALCKKNIVFPKVGRRCERQPCIKPGWRLAAAHEAQRSATSILRRGFSNPPPQKAPSRPGPVAPHPPRANAQAVLHVFDNRAVSRHSLLRGQGKAAAVRAGGAACIGKGPGRRKMRKAACQKEGGAFARGMGDQATYNCAPSHVTFVCFFQTKKLE